MSNYYANYWVNDLPIHWGSRKLKFIARVKLSNVDKKSHENETPVYLCNYVDVYYNVEITDKLNFMKATASKGQVAELSITKGDVLITKDSETRIDIAVSSYVSENLPSVVCGYHLAHIRPNMNLLNGSYLNRAFNSIGIRDQLIVEANGVTRFGIGDSNIKDAVFPLPPLPEQQDIARFLDHKTGLIDQYISNKKKQIKLLEKLHTSIISEAVTKGLDPDVEMKDSGMEWLGMVPKHWEIKKLRFLVRYKGGGTPSKGNADYWNGDIPWVSPKDMDGLFITDTVDHITSKAINESSTSLVEANTIVMVVRSGILRRKIPVAILSVDAALNQDMKAMIVKRGYLSTYLLYVIIGNQISFLSQWVKEGATVESIEFKLLTDTRFPVPPHNEQETIIKYIDTKINEIDNSIGQLHLQIKKMQAYRTSLISEAVTGKIDVRNFNPEPLDDLLAQTE